MATTNFDRFKALMEKQNAAKSPKQSGPTWFKAEKGVVHTLRFLPLKSQNLELPLEFYHHHALQFPDGKFESFACRQRKGEGDCPFCKLATDTYKKHLQTGLQDSPYKDAFKQLVAKTQYLLVGYETDKIDTANLTEKDLKIVRASSKAAMEQIETALAKGRDFVDFKDGRDIELRKPAGKGDIVAVVWEFQDSAPAFDGKSGKAVWDKLVELSPDLTNIVASPSDDQLQKLMDRFTSAPVASEPLPEKSVPSIASRGAVKPLPTLEEDGVDCDIDALRRHLGEV